AVQSRPSRHRESVISIEARRRGREVEGTPLLREHAAKNCIEGSNPSVSARMPLRDLNACRHWHAGQHESFRSRPSSTSSGRLRRGDSLQLLRQFVLGTGHIVTELQPGPEAVVQAEVSGQAQSGVHGDRALAGHDFADAHLWHADLHVACSTVHEAEADSPLVVDVDAPLAPAVRLRRFEAVVGRNPEFLDPYHWVEYPELSH